MEAIKRKWFFVSLVYFFVVYYFFVIHLKGSQPLLFVSAVSIFIGITIILFLGNIVGFPGLILHAFFYKPDKALPFYQAAHRLGSKGTQMLSAYGLVMLRNGNPQKAKELFEEAAANNRSAFYARTLEANLAICEWKLGNPQLAYEKYLALYYASGEDRLTSFDQKDLESGININPDFAQQDFLTLGYLAHLVGKKEEALYFSRIALYKDDNYAAAYDNLGQIYFEDGDLETAKEHFEKAIALKPSLMDSHFYLSKIALAQNNKELAKQHYENAASQPINGLNTVSGKQLDALKAELS